MGHAGAIISGGKGGAKDKINKMQDCGITIANSPSKIGKTLFFVMNKKQYFFLENIFNRINQSSSRQKPIANVLERNIQFVYQTKT